MMSSIYIISITINVYYVPNITATLSALRVTRNLGGFLLPFLQWYRLQSIKLNKQPNKRYV